ncbi:uncharacterized protein LOC116960958 [Tyto alba]|uniref:uncharacterized protein LOC116960958 n=1 Tax=Tyto alba TaxID=56313 RepID=UPI001C68692F|nr:uncharacterized protein LOC116960958 [Tyto alba]
MVEGTGQIQFMVLLAHISDSGTRITESQGGRDLEDQLVQPSLAKASLDKVAQHPVQLNLKSVRCWGIHHCPGEIIPAADCSREFDGLAPAVACIHDKLASKLHYDALTFSGPHISLRDLRRQIMAREKLKAANCHLQISNAQSKEEYTDDNALIPKNSSVIVRRIPVGGVKATSKTCVRSRTEPVSGTSRAVCKTQSLTFFYTLHLILNNVALY